MVGCQKGKNNRETTKRRIVKSLVKQRSGRVSKTGRILSENGRLPAKTGGLESMPIFLIDFRWSIDAIQDNTFLKYLPAFPYPPYLYELIKKNFNSIKIHLIDILFSVSFSLFYFVTCRKPLMTEERN